MKTPAYIIFASFIVLVILSFLVTDGTFEPETGIIVTQKIDIVYQNGDRETVYRSFDNGKYTMSGTAYRHPHLYKGCIDVVGRCYVRSFTETEYIK